MDVVHWTIADVDRRSRSLIVEELHDAAILILDDATAEDDDRLTWCRTAPCPVVAATADPGPGNVDIVTTEVDVVVKRTLAAPRAARILVDVLRTSEELDIRPALIVESLAYSTLLASAEFRGWLDGRPTRRPRVFDGDAIEVSRRDGHVRLTLARPENRNAFSAQMRDGLADALTSVALDATIERLTIDARGPVFSSGGDLTEFGSAADVAVAHGIRTLRNVGAVLAELTIPVTVEVHGTCVGAGVELPAFAPNVVADPGSSFRLPEIEMGLIPGAGGTVSLARRIGRQRTAELALSGRVMSVDEACEVGLVDVIRPVCSDR